MHKTKQRQECEALARGEDSADVKLRQQGAFEQEVGPRHAAVKLAKAQVEIPQPAEEEGKDMDVDEEESEASDKGGTKSTPIEVVVKVVEPREDKPLDAKPKPRVEMPTTGAMPVRVEVTPTTAIGQWVSGPPKDKRRVVLDEAPVGDER